MDDDLPTRQSGWRRLLRSVVRVSGRADEAEDLLQSAFVRLEEYGRRAEVVSPRAFMVRVASNLARDDDRRLRARRECSVEVLDPATICDDHPLQHEVFEARERLERVMAALESLGPRTRDIFLMHRVDGLKYREIAEIRGVSVSAVEKHIARAVLFLADWTETE